MTKLVNLRSTMNSEGPIDNGVVRVQFTKVGSRQHRAITLWTEAKGWPQHHTEWPVPNMFGEDTGAVRVGYAFIAPLGFLVDPTYD